VIEVKRTGEGDPLEFAVIVRVGDGETRHHVTMVRDTCERLTAGTHTPERCIEAAFEFLLDREPKESILRRFDVTVSRVTLPPGSRRSRCRPDRQRSQRRRGSFAFVAASTQWGGVFGLMKPGNGAGFPRPARHGGEIGRMNADAKTLRETWGLNCAACGLDLASPPGSRGAVL
jgi:hypothetical protein